MTFLANLARIIDTLNERVGRAVSWLALFIVVVQFTVVVLRYVFGIGSIFMQESIVYMHAIVFLIAAGYTLFHEGHVRIDIFYSRADAKRKAMVDLAGAVFFLLPMCVLIFLISWPYVSRSWRVLEVSQEGSGIPGVFLLKTVILIYAVLLFLQGLSLAMRSILAVAGEDAGAGKVEDRDEAVP